MKYNIGLLLTSTILVLGISACNKANSITSESSSSNPSSSDSSSTTSEGGGEGSEEGQDEENIHLPIESISLFNEKELKMSVNNGYTVASMSVTGEYLDEEVKIDVNVIDSLLADDAFDVGMGDNVEFKFQGYNSSWMCEGLTYNFLCDYNGRYWLKRLSGDTFYDISLSEIYRQTGGWFDYSASINEKGYHVTFSVSYKMLGLNSKEEAINNFRIMPAMRNKQDWKCNVYNEYEELGVNYWFANTWPILSGKNRWVRTDFETYSLSEDCDNISSLVSSLGKLTPAENSIIEPVRVSSQIFTNSLWGLHRYYTPDELYGCDAVIGSKAGNGATVNEAGNIIVAVNSSNTSLCSYFANKGFTRIAYRAPALLSQPNNGDLHDYGQLTNYYVKNCSVGESFSYSGLWAMFFCKHDESTPDFEWNNPDNVYVDAEAINDPYYNVLDESFTCGGSIAATKNGHLLTTFMTGGLYEPLFDNHSIISLSVDEGKTWEHVAVIDTFINKEIAGDKNVVVTDFNFTNDSENNVYCTFDLRGLVSIAPSATSYCCKLKNAEKDPSEWELADVSPILEAGWSRSAFFEAQDGTFFYAVEDSADNRYTYVMSSKDKGITWEMSGSIYAPDCYNFDEAIIFERSDGSLVTYFRNESGYIIESRGDKYGENWTIAVTKHNLLNPCTRFTIKRDASGILVMVYNHSNTARKNMTVAISLDDGETWIDKINMYPDNRYCSYPELILLNGKYHTVFDDGRYEENAWRYEQNGDYKCWGFIYHYSFTLQELLDMDFEVLNPLTDLDVVAYVRKYVGSDFDFAGRGTEEYPFLIQNSEDVDKFDEYLKINSFTNIHFKLETDIGTIENPRTSFFNYAAGHKFQGVFDGNNHTVYLDVSTSSKTAGLFGYLNKGAIIKNLNIEGSIESTLSGEALVGALAGECVESSIINVTNNANITAVGYSVGGIVGFAHPGAIIQSCYNKGNLTTTSTSIDHSYGGIAGITGITSSDVHISDCHNTGKIEGKCANVAGIVGKLAQANIEDPSTVVDGCTNNAPIKGTNCCGGIIGRSVAGPVIKNCINGTNDSQNRASISSTGYSVGGVVGYLDNQSSIISCVNYGTVTSTTNNTNLGERGIGGIMGTGNKPKEITDCHNYGNVTATAAYLVGGIGGKIIGADNGSPVTISNCSSTGTLIGAGHVGAIVGRGNYLIIRNCIAGGILYSLDYATCSTGIYGSTNDESGVILENTTDNAERREMA